MSSLEEIKDQVKSAMQQSCLDMIEFIGDPSKTIAAEYLFTVNAAKSIAELNVYRADKYKIFLERNTNTFSNECLTPIIRGHPLKKNSTKFRKLTKGIERKGRIDIAVYTGHHRNNVDGETPICAIELKSFNPSKKGITSDLKRNIDYFNIEGTTGKSRIDFTIFAALHSFKKKDNAEQIRKNEQSIKDKYKNILENINITNKITTEIDIFTISSDTEGEYTEEEIDTSTKHHFAGAIIVFKKNEGPKSEKTQ